MAHLTTDDQRHTQQYMKPSSAKHLSIKNHWQKQMQKSTILVAADEGSPAGNVCWLCATGNQKSSKRNAGCNVLITYCLT
jgi:hypothetical protein